MSCPPIIPPWKKTNRISLRTMTLPRVAEPHMSPHFSISASPADPPSHYLSSRRANAGRGAA
jgi:hypothetical protein